MANEEHLKILQKGAEVWNQWRNENPTIIPNLNEADLNGVGLIFGIPSAAEMRDIDSYLSGTSFNRANLSRASLIGADFKGLIFSGFDLSKANLSKANLSCTQLNKANLSGANLSNASLDGANLSGANLKETDCNGASLIRAILKETTLDKTDFRNSILSRVDLSGIDLRNTIFSNVDLSKANLSRANLSGVNLSASQAVNANFTDAILTGACIAAWQIDSSTRFDGVICDHVYRRINENGKFSGRLPANHNSLFVPGEFELWAKIKAVNLETIDLTFLRGINWQNFFRSLQEVKIQNPDVNIFLQGIEEENGRHLVRLKAEIEPSKEDNLDFSAKSDKIHKNRILLEGKIEASIKDSYMRKQHSNEDNGEAITSFQSLEQVLQMTVSQGSSKYINIQNIQDSQISLADIIQGNQIYNNYGHDTDEIIRLVSSLSELSQVFPETQQQQVQVHLEDLTTDLKQPEKCSKARLKTRLAGLFGVLILLGGGIATATDFANNVLELSTKLNVSAEEFQPQLQQLKQIYPNFDWQS